MKMGSIVRIFYRITIIKLHHRISSTNHHHVMTLARISLTLSRHFSCRNFGKELVILFHRTAAAPCGHVVSIIKRSSTGDSLSFGSTTNTASTGPFRSSPWWHTYLVPSTTSQDPRATNARAGLTGTGHTQLSSSRHFICKPTLSTSPYLQSHKPYQTYFITTLQLNLTKPFQLSELCELLFELLLTHSLFIPFGVKPCLLL